MSYRNNEEGGEATVSTEVNYYPDTRSDRRKCGALIAAIIFPPLGPLIMGCNTSEFVIVLILTLLGWIPGLIFALYYIFCR